MILFELEHKVKKLISLMCSGTPCSVYIPLRFIDQDELQLWIRTVQEKEAREDTKEEHN